MNIAAATLAFRFGTCTYPKSDTVRASTACDRRTDAGTDRPVVTK